MSDVDLTLLSGRKRLHYLGCGGRAGCLEGKTPFPLSVAPGPDSVRQTLSPCPASSRHAGAASVVLS